MKTYEELFNEKISTIRKESQGRKIYLWGAGKFGALTAKLCEENNIEISGFIDARADEMIHYMGYLVHNSGFLKVQEHYVIISMKSIQKGMVDYLIQKGFKDNDFCFVNLENCRNEEDIVYKGVKIGRFTYGYEFMLLQDFPLATRIGRFTSINMSAKILNNHPMGYVTTHPMLDTPIFCGKDFVKRNELCHKYGKYFENHESDSSPLRKNMPVEIGNDVWIGANVCILPGVHIGDGAIVATGAVVTNDVEPYSIVGGVPAKFLKYRFDKEVIEKMLEIKWWDWPLSKIEENIELFYDLDLFINKFSKERNV